MTVLHVVEEGAAAGAGPASSAARPPRPLRWRVLMRCHACRGAEAVVVAASVFPHVCACSCGGLRYAEEVERLPPELVVVRGGLSS